VLIQGNCGTLRPCFLPVRRALFRILFIVLAGGCSVTPQTPPTPDFSNLSPSALLSEFLQAERSRGAVKFNFSGTVDVLSGKTHRFRGFGGYEDCGSLRLQLLGPLGFTLLDYLNVDGEATLVTNKLTPEEDLEARAGLLQLMHVFTLALVDRCYSREDVQPQSHDAITADYSASTPRVASLEFTLERRNGAVKRQSLAGKGLPVTRVRYRDYRKVDDFWMPGKIEVRITDMPVSIDMSIEEWNIGVELPEEFFAVHQ